MIVAETVAPCRATERLKEGAPMRSVTMSILAAVVLVIAGAWPGRLRAQTAPDPQMHHGQGYQHSFQDAEKWAKAFDDPARDAWQKPDEILNALQLQRTDRVADLGAGTGYFSVRIAKLIPDGKLFAVDIEPDMLRHLRQRVQNDNLGVLVPILASAESANLPEPVDLVIVVDTYHHIDNRVAYFSRLKSSLRPNGRLAIVDFTAASSEGPPRDHRIPSEQVTSELESAGYALVATHAFLPRQYFLVFQAKTS